MELVLYICIGLVIGGLLSYLITRITLSAKHRQEMKVTEDQLIEFEKQVSSFQAKAEAQAESMKVARESMLDTFKSAATEALGKNNQQFLDLAKTKVEGDLDKRKASIEEMLKPVKESIDSYKKRIEELEKGSEKTFGQVTEMLSSIQATHLNLQKETGALVNALRNPQVRGRWGEIGLKRVVEFSGMSAHCDFTEQVHKEGEDSTIKPDMVVNLPGEGHIVVDSKLTLDAYLQALETDDEDARKVLFTKHAKDLRDRIVSLSRKQYWSQFENTPDFVILYMEVESAFNVALMTDKTLLQDAMNNKIILATPTTLMVVLKSVAMSWQQHNITENANQIMETASELHNRLTTFADHLGKVGSGLKTALSGYNDAVGSYEGRILPAGKKLEELEAVSGKKDLSNINVIDQTVRELKKTEE